MQDNYTTLGLYRNKHDPRLIVPKRNPGMGWTINLGHPFGPATLSGICLLPVAALILAKSVA